MHWKIPDAEQLYNLLKERDNPMFVLKGEHDGKEQLLAHCETKEEADAYVSARRDLDLETKVKEKKGHCVPPKFEDE